MQKRHGNYKQYFDEQAAATEKYILPYIEKAKKITAKTRVLEIGCGQAGNLQPFLERGCICVGVDLHKSSIELAKNFYAEHPNVNNMTLIAEDIYNVKEFQYSFDVIFLRDVIEHIHNQEYFLAQMKTLLAPDGVAFFAFPPWQNPFGGHQQVCRNKFLSHLPYFHLLPMPIYKWILCSFGEGVGGLAEVKETGISIERFERILRKNNYTQIARTLWFINPNYETKFGLKPRKLFCFFAKIPYLRNFYCTCGYYLIKL